MQEFSSYYCSAEWHLSQLKSKYAVPIYFFGLHISNKSDLFFCSAGNLATYFNCHRNTIYAALKQLQQLEFIEVVSKSYFEAVNYRVIQHDEWATFHPNRCVEKLEFPWSAEANDPLAPQLYAVSGGKVKLLVHQAKALHEICSSDTVIISCFKQFLLNTTITKSTIPRFIKYLRDIMSAKSSITVTAA